MSDRKALAALAAASIVATSSASCTRESPIPSTLTSASFVDAVDRTNDAGASSNAGNDAESPAGFRLRPAPNSEGLVDVALGGPLNINAASLVGMVAPGSRLRVDWGDGSRTSAACGACRIQHTYQAAGLYDVVATLGEQGDIPPSQTGRWTAHVEPEPTCAGAEFPFPQSVTLNTGTRAMTWDSVGGNSYNLYIKAVDGCDQFDLDERATTRDLKIAAVTSPFDISSFNHCHTCYYWGMTVVSGQCESVILGSGGFKLYPCS